MTKEKFLKIKLLIFMLVFCLHFNGPALAGDCAGKANGVGTPTVQGNYEYTDSWFPKFQYDPANPQTIDRNNTITINIIGGIPPYTWSVSGTGFTMEESQTMWLSNTLIADGTA